MQYANPVPRIAAIHDLSGYGRSSLTVAIPVLSTMGIQVCPLPTAVLSSQTTGMKDFSFFDLTSQMGSILDHWARLNIMFDAVYSGFLGSPEQVNLVERCIRERLKPSGLTIVDPVLGDDGVLDPTQTTDMVDSMRQLVRKADIITPNLTEASFLLGEPYDKDMGSCALKDSLIRLAEMGPRVVVITSAPCPNASASPLPASRVVLESDAVSEIPYSDAVPPARFLRVVAYEKDSRRFWQVRHPYIPAYFPGTGDTFASVLTGALLQGDSVPISMARAAAFVQSAILTTYGYNTPFHEGVMLERILGDLRSPARGGYEEF